MVWLLLSTFTNIDYIDDNYPYKHFDTFSLGWVCVIMYVLLVAVSMKKDLTLFMKMGSVGTCCVCILIVYVIYQFVASISQTQYQIKIVAPDNEPETSIVDLVMFSTGFGNIMGILCTGFFIHQCSLPLVQAAAEPEKTNRNVFLGYLAVFVTYLLVGIFGYIGFTGEEFQDTLKDSGGLIPDNFLQILPVDNVPAIIVRALLFIQLGAAYPLLNHF